MSEWRNSNVVIMNALNCVCSGFDVRNYVAIAFCAVWLIVDCILMFGIYRVRHAVGLPIIHKPVVVNALIFMQNRSSASEFAYGCPLLRGLSSVTSCTRVDGLGRRIYVWQVSLISNEKKFRKLNRLAKNCTCLCHVPWGRGSD